MGVPKKERKIAQEYPNCTFCGNAQNEVVSGNDPKLTSWAKGPVVYICRDCVKLCCEIFDIHLCTCERKPR